MTSQKGSAHLLIIIGLVVLLLGSLGFIFWQNFVQTDDEASKTEKVATKEQVKEPATSEQKKLETVDEADYTFTVVEGFNKSSEQWYKVYRKRWSKTYR